MVLTPASLAARLDHSLLRADARPEEILRLCDEALAFGFAAVCVNGAHTARAAERLAGSAVRVATVVGFPLGAGATAAKLFEAERAVEEGARELDLVIQLGALRANDDAWVREEVAAVVEATRTSATLVKTILETGLLEDEEKRRAARLCVEAGARMLKTSTGFAGSGASEADVRLLRSLAPPGVGVKAAGGIRTLAQARSMLEAGADRLGTSSGAAIVRALEVERPHDATASGSEPAG